MHALATYSWVSMTVAGAVLLAGSAFFGWRLLTRVRLRLAGYVATATVVDCEIIEGDDDEDDPDIYTWIVDFTTRAGERRTDVALSDPQTHFPGRGSTVTVVYRPHDPRWATMTDWYGGFLHLVALPFTTVLGGLLVGWGVNGITSW